MTRPNSPTEITCPHCGFVQTSPEVGVAEITCRQCGRRFAGTATGSLSEGTTPAGNRPPRPAASASSGPASLFDSLNLESLEQGDMIVTPGNSRPKAAPAAGSRGDSPSQSSSASVQAAPNKPVDAALNKSVVAPPQAAGGGTAAAASEQPNESRRAAETMGGQPTGPRPPVFSAQPSLVFPDLQSGEDLDVAWLAERPESPTASSTNRDEPPMKSPGDPQPSGSDAPVSGTEAHALEVLEDDLFQDLEHLDSDASDQTLRIDGMASASQGQVISVRCRVCDTLQYIESRAGNRPHCDVCHAPIPLQADGTPINTKGQGRGAWTAPATLVRNVSAEGVGTAEPASSGDRDEIDELIRTAQAEPLTPPESSSTTEINPPIPENDKELQLAPLDSNAGVGLDLLLLEDETRSLLHSRADELIETDVHDLVPLEDDAAEAAADPLSTATATGQAGIIGGTSSSGTSSSGTSSGGTSSGSIAASGVGLPRDPLLDDLLYPGASDIGSSAKEAVSAVTPPPLVVGNAGTQSPVAREWGTGSSDNRDAMRSTAAYSSTAALATEPVSSHREGSLPPTPPTFTAFGKPAATQPPYLKSAGNAAADAAEQATSSSSGGNPDERIEQFLQRAVVSLWHLSRALLRPFGSWQLLGTALLLLPLVIWMQTSWNAAAGDGKTIEKITGYVYLLLSSAAGLPLWLGLLGVIANRQSAMGQDGRLSWPAIALQAGQFAVVLALAVPGAAVGTPSGWPLLVGCLAAYTMLPAGLYFVTSAIVAHDWFAFRHPAVIRSFSERLADWAAAGVVVGLILLLGTLMALITAFMETIGPTLFGMFIIPTSMAYAATIGFLADRILTLTEQ